MFSSCRKEIPEEPVSNIDANTAYFVKPWRQISLPDFKKGRAFAIFNEELYIAAQFGFDGGTDHYLYKLSSLPYTDYTYPDAYTGDWGYFKSVFEFNDFGSPQGVFAMKVINNRLYIAGDFRVNNGQYDVIYLDASGGKHTVGFSSSTFGSTVVNHIGVYNGDPLLCGNFVSSGNTQFLTDYVELLENNNAVGMADLSSTAHDSQEYNGDLYVVGDLDQIVKWNGSGWDPVVYPNNSSSDRVYSVEIFNSELYFLGDFSGNEVIKKFSPTDGWTSFANLTNFVVPNYSELRVLNGELYVIGKGYMSEGIKNSIWKYAGGDTWQQFGNLTNIVWDVTYFKNKYYAGTEDGVYIY